MDTLHGDGPFRLIGSDLHMDYTAVGQTTHLAARMEQMATAGSILHPGQTAPDATRNLLDRPVIRAVPGGRRAASATR